MTAGRRALVALIAAALVGCDGDAGPTATLRPHPSTRSRATVDVATTVLDTSTDPTTTVGGTTSTVAPSAPGLDGLLAGPGDVPFAVTSSPVTPPTTICGQLIVTPSLDARASALTDETGAVAVSSLVEVHASPPLAAQALSERTEILDACDWGVEMPAQARAHQVDARVVVSPDLVAGLPACDDAVTAAAVRTTTDEAPAERREILVVMAVCGDLMASVRIELLDQLPAEQLPWVAPLLTTMLTRLAAAA